MNFCHAIDELMVLFLINFCVIDTFNKRSLDWKPSVYPDLQSPDSPGITLQWTYRDGVLVNLPAVLLVLGDIVLIRPSQRVHCRCLILAEDSEETTKNLTLQVGDVFQPDVEGELEHPVGPKERESASPCRFTVLDAPFKVHLQVKTSHGDFSGISLCDDVCRNHCRIRRCIDRAASSRSSV